MRVQLRRFPGEKSPGLIEARKRASAAVTVRRLAFPGEKSPGLIEAIPVGGYLKEVDDEFPGEKSPGLIEAMPVHG